MQRNLKWMLLLRVGAIVFVILVINAVIAGYFFKNEFIMRIQAQGEAISKDIISDAEQSLSAFSVSEEVSRVFNYWLAKMVEDHDYLLGAALIDHDGAYISHSDPDMMEVSIPGEVLKRLGDRSQVPFRTGRGYAYLMRVGEADGKPIAHLMLEFDPVEFSKPMNRLLMSLIVMVLLSLGLIYLMLDFLAVSKVSKPLSALVHQTELVSTGDLTQKSPEEGVGEIRLLSQAFNVMANNLREVVSTIRSVSDKFTETCRKLFMLSGEINQGSRQQMSSLNGASEAVRKMGTNVEEISTQTEDLNHLSQNASASILEMTASIAEVDSNVENLVVMVDEIASSILEITQTTREVAASVESLSREAESSASSVSQMNTTLSQVDAGAAKSAEKSVLVTETAESGIRSIEKTQEGMGAIRASAESTAASINRLGEQSKKIGKIIRVINKIAEETNLLALNAAIIAAEAGEHGRGFNVVANEIQMLAEKTTLQTKEIDALIKDVQKETQDAVQKVQQVLESVGSGQILTSDTENILQSIVTVANEAKSLIQQIARATDEQAQGVKRVAQGSEKISSEVNHISTATKEQAAGTSKVMDAIERIRDLARGVQIATREQSEGSKSISNATEQVRDLVSHVHHRAVNHRKDAELVTDIVARNLQIVEENVRRLQEMEVSVEELLSQTTSLSDEIRRFRVHRHEDEEAEEETV